MMERKQQKKKPKTNVYSYAFMFVFELKMWNVKRGMKRLTRSYKCLITIKTKEKH